MRPIEGTVTDPAMDQYSVKVNDEVLIVEGLDQYQDLAGETAIYPRVYTEHQVRSMLTRAYVNGSGYYDLEVEDVQGWVDHDLKANETPFNRLVYPILGLVGEAGEIANKAKKIARDNQGQMDTESVEDIGKELGDVGWYFAAISRELGTKLSKIATKNVAKLFSRKARGVLGGSGDNR